MTSISLILARSLGALLLGLGAITALPGCTDSTSSTDLRIFAADTITGRHFIQARLFKDVVVTGQCDRFGKGGIDEVCVRELDSGYFATERHTFTRYDSDNRRDDSYRSLEIIFMRRFPVRPEAGQLDVLVNRGRMPFGGEADMRNGVEIRWTDQFGEVWSTANRHQYWGQFVVREHAEQEYAPDARRGGRYYTRGSFNGCLYSANGDSIVVNDGTFALETVWAW